MVPEVQKVEPEPSLVALSEPSAGEVEVLRPKALPTPASTAQKPENCSTPRRTALTSSLSQFYISSTKAEKCCTVKGAV